MTSPDYVAGLLDRLQSALGPDYVLDREIGRGGMATVFLANDTALGRKVAIKVLSDDRASGINVDRFRREIQFTARLHHPHIVPIYGAGKAADVLYYTMPFVPGESLRDRLQREGRLPADVAVQIACEVANALDYAHRQGVIHRDIKPENILLHDGHALVADFGIARAFGDALSSTAITLIGTVLGTPAYMSPEQVTGENVDARSDVYSLGCVLYEMLAGQPPFTGGSFQRIAAQHLVDPPPRVRDAAPSVPELVERVILKALTKSAEDRFATPAAFARALAGNEPVPRITTSVAVLPFENLSRDPSQDFFSDGMTEALITDLAKAGAFKVISRTSVMPYKSSGKPMPQIARELGVDALVEGSVLHAGARVRITAQLIDGATDAHLWAETFDRDLTDIFALQSEVARAIVARVTGKLTAGQRKRIITRESVDPEAYAAYLRGRFHWYRFTPGDLDTALHYFARALERAPEYALPYSGIAEVWGGRAALGVTAPHDAWPQARDMALRAIELDDTLAAGHNTLGAVKSWYDWDWEGAEADFLRAIELNPSYADARIFYGLLLTALKRFDDARHEFGRGIELDPLNPFFAGLHGWHLAWTGHWDEAAAEFRRALAAVPNYPQPRWGLMIMAASEGRDDEALAHAQALFAAIADRESEQALLAGASRGGFAEAMANVGDSHVKRARSMYVKPTAVATYYAFAGRTDDALQWLERAIDMRDSDLTYLGVMPLPEPVRTDPRFVNLLRRLRLPASR